jgi:hypothetical protein
MLNRTRTPEYQRVIEHFGSGNQLAKFLGVSRQAVSFWRRIPEVHVNKLAAEMGVEREKIRPDLNHVWRDSQPKPAPEPAPVRLPDVRKTWPF